MNKKLSMKAGVLTVWTFTRMKRKVPIGTVIFNGWRGTNSILAGRRPAGDCLTLLKRFKKETFTGTRLIVIGYGQVARLLVLRISTASLGKGKFKSALTALPTSVIMNYQKCGRRPCRGLQMTGNKPYWCESPMKNTKKQVEPAYDGEIYNRQSLEKMPNWVGTFRQLFCIASPRDHLVCLLKKPKGGYWWKMPDKEHVTDADLVGLQNALNQRRLELVKGKLPRGVKSPKNRFAVAV